YELIPRAAVAVEPPLYLDGDGNVLPADAPGEQVVTSVYDVRIKPGIMFQPHPAFARDASGKFEYWPMAPEALEGKFSITDFEHTGTRELVADDYVYAFRRLASPRVVSPIYGVMASHVVGMRAYGDQLKEAEQASREQGEAGG